MKVSVIYSNYNRSALMEAGLTYLCRQTLPKEAFEVVVVDDMSTDDYAPLLEKFAGRLRIQWVRIDHTRHDVFPRLNPSGVPIHPPEDEVLWYHTPALSHNVGMRCARGEVICITQPEILMHPAALERGYAAARGGTEYTHAQMYLSERWWREHVLPMILEGNAPPYDKLKEYDGWKGAEGISCPELYWYLAFIHRDAPAKVGGADEEYLMGAYAEDDDFRFRLGLAGYPRKVHREIEGIHINHQHVNTGRHDREGLRWKEGRKRNRGRWSVIQRQKGPIVANANREWGSKNLIVQHKLYDAVGGEG